MKKIFFLFILLATLGSCKKDTNTETKENETTTEDNKFTLIEGDFIYYADAAVLQTQTSIYGVVLNDKVTELAKQAKAFQKEPTDMVRVRIRGVIEKKPEGEEGWDFNVNIKKIVSVRALNDKENDIIKIGS